MNLLRQRLAGTVSRAMAHFDIHNKIARLLSGSAGSVKGHQLLSQARISDPNNVAPFARCDGKQQLLLGIRRGNRQPTNLSSSALSSDSMHMGVVATATHAAANNSPFTVFYNPGLARQNL